MILRSFKRNALKKNIESHLKKRSSLSNNITDLKTVGVLIDASQQVNTLPMDKLSDVLGVKPDSIKVMGYKRNKDEIVDDEEASYYNDENFSIKGAVKSSSLEKFINSEYDVLINFYAEDVLALNYVATASKAKFKVGFAEADNRINDLIICSSIGDSDLFILELKKYLKILQIL